jgi:hypothetical protein
MIIVTRASCAHLGYVSGAGRRMADPIIAWRRIKRRHERFRKREIAVDDGFDWVAGRSCGMLYTLDPTDLQNYRLKKQACKTVHRLLDTVGGRCRPGDDGENCA